MIIDSRTLVKPFSNKACFKPINGAIKISFDAINPPAANKVSDTIRGNKFPRAISNKGIIFLRHSFTPVGIFEGLRSVGRFDGGGG